ncbi:UDP-N-acetylmuramoyl-L-alanine--D-glutamate ligase [Alphaproteobacteria bacterium]|nr:UDP-N-acetylmuramoyl-L-alanine--D-glutamate ligase [Alphaproteobacteria bacterium]MDC0453143.1 UDP-N-acetylmuramoyl-L-alanine--D-glutamate ligase [Alphaproteobacteria bacterium]
MSDYVYGLNKSGLSVIKLLYNQKKIFDCWDDNKKIRHLANKRITKLNLKKINKKKINLYKNIYLTPGISLNDKRFKNISNSKIKRDLDLYYESLKDEKIIAITGTNGKSTTTKLIGDILKKKYRKTFVGGNLGEPLCNSIKKNFKYTHHVVELSSFQLETIKRFNPNVSVILNLSKDHLDRYKNIKNYILAKKNILNSGGKNINLISIDDVYSNRIFLDKKIKNKISFSTKKITADIFCNKDCIIDNYFHKNKKIKLLNLSSDLNNSYNLQNILASYIVCKYFKIPIKYFNESIKNFQGLPYRSLTIHNSKSKLIINNSKATNISSSLSTLENKKNIYLILGGVAKEEGFSKFNKFRNNIDQIYIYGKSRFKIKNQINLSKISIIKKNLQEVINTLWNDLSNKNHKVTIVFAPACTSFDQFENFEKRGAYFNQLILNKLKK